MTNEHIDELLAEIGRAPLITSGEERVLIKAVKEKGTDCDEMKQLEQANMRFVVSLISHYQHRGLTLEELIESGKAGLRIAIENYDLDSDSKFIAYAVTQMRQSIEELMTLNCTKNESWGNTKGE
jgi:RNA polymerase primary sigma factor